MPDIIENRTALIPVLARQSRNGYLGRTALMKYMYFLQTLRGVPLGYRFTLYSYGPFDAEVLAELENAEGLGVVESRPLLYPVGYGYEIRPGPQASWLEERAADFLKGHEADIQWVTEAFGPLNSSQLELVSTLVFVDREFEQAGRECDVEDVIEAVREIKPRFSMSEVVHFAGELEKRRLLRSVR